MLPRALRLTTGLIVFASCFALPQEPSELVDPDPVFRSDVRLVEVSASVFDKHGDPLPGLTRDRFQVLDNGAPQQIVSFEGVGDKVSCALLMDVTDSMDAFLPVLKNAAVRFADELPTDEEVGVYTFNTSVQLAQPFTSDKNLIKQAVLRARAHGSTALFDAISGVSRDLQLRKGKKAMILFTDGADNASTLTAHSASRRARLSGVPVYANAEGDALTDRGLLETLKTLATDSGGLVFRLDKANEIDDVFSAIARDLRNTYLVAWKLPESAGTAYRSIRISVTGVTGARIRARQGYIPN
jgi:Ca-activated chloride channel family protein